MAKILRINFRQDVKKCETVPKVEWRLFPPWFHVNMWLQTTWAMNNQVPLAAVRYVVVDPMSLALALCCREETPNAHDHPKLRGWILNKNNEECSEGDIGYVRTGMR